MGERLTLEQVRDFKAQIDALDEAIGGYSSSHQVREKGASLHIKFDNKVDLFKVTLPFVNVLLRAPSLIWQLLDQLEELLTEEAATESAETPKDAA